MKIFFFPPNFPPELSKPSRFSLKSCFSPISREFHWGKTPIFWEEESPIPLFSHPKIWGILREENFISMGIPSRILEKNQEFADLTQHLPPQSRDPSRDKNLRNFFIGNRSHPEDKSWEKTWDEFPGINSTRMRPQGGKRNQNSPVKFWN